MVNFTEVKGAIFDLDDTLLDNGPLEEPAKWLHARSRLAAIHEVADKYDIQPLLEVTPEENIKGFLTASVHSSLGAVWNVMYMKELVSDPTVDPSHSLYPLAERITMRKDELHEAVLREFGVELPGASRFLKTLAVNGLAKHMALATSAIQRDISIVLDKYNWHEYFPPNRIISAEKVTKHKPDPECFDLAFQSLELPDSVRRNVLAFEDNPRGIQSAKAAGLFVCAITSRLGADDPAMRAAQPDLIANSYDEFARLLHLPLRET